MNIERTSWLGYTLTCLIKRSRGNSISFHHMILFVSQFVPWLPTLSTHVLLREANKVDKKSKNKILTKSISLMIYHTCCTQYLWLKWADFQEHSPNRTSRSCYFSNQIRSCLFSSWYSFMFPERALEPTDWL